MILINGAQASNVFWAVGGLPGAVINYGGGGTMVGTIISQPGITVSSPGSCRGNDDQRQSDWL